MGAWGWSDWVSQEGRLVQYPLLVLVMVPGVSKSIRTSCQEDEVICPVLEASFIC